MAAAAARLFDHFGNEIQAVADVRRIALQQRALILFRDDVRTQPLGQLQRVGERPGRGGVDGLKLIDEIDDPRELAREIGHLGVGYFEAGELAQFLDGFGLQ